MSTAEQGIDSAVEIELRRQSHGAWPSITACIREIAFYNSDSITLGHSQNEIRVQECVYNIDSLIEQEHTIRIRLTPEDLPAQHSVLSALHKQTIFGLPFDFYKNSPVSKTRFYWGVSREPLNLSNNSTPAAPIRSRDGIEYSLVKSSHPRVDFVYLDRDRELKTKQVDCLKYVSPDTSNLLNRYKVKLKAGFTLYSLFPQESFSIDAPHSDWSDLIKQINQMAENAVEEHLRAQVAKIENRILDVTSRRILFIGDSKIGVAPVNELETVILFERYIARNNGLLGKTARLRILDYSPQGIDSICEFSPSQNTPLKVVPVEFEYLLKNFFDHGHDPDQVELILCYTIKPLTFPYDHFGVTYDLDRSGEFPRLVDVKTGKHTLVFALDEVLEEK